jgi:hypothetical protein
MTGNYFLDACRKIFPLSSLLEKKEERMKASRLHDV